VTKIMAVLLLVPLLLLAALIMAGAAVWDATGADR
jgi:hypothetical protein